MSRKQPERPAVSKSEGRGASAAKKESAIVSYLSHHKKVFKESFIRLYLHPVATLMNWLVVGIAISFPAASLLLISDMEMIANNLEDGNQITLFLKPRVSEADGKQLSLKISQRSQVASVDFISKEEALNQLKEIAGFKEALSLLDENPLPATILVNPSGTLVSANQIASLSETLAGFPEVDSMQMDLEWVDRLFSIMELASRVVIVVGALFLLAVLLVISNTIRLAIENRRKEIRVVKMVGGTDSFVRRPFLYMGLWFGVGGSVIAVILIEVGFSWLNQPITKLAASYGSQFKLAGFDGFSFIVLLLVGMGLGLLGARHAVGRHLKDMEP